jgi:hypothetical protein
LTAALIERRRPALKVLPVQFKPRLLAALLAPLALAGAARAETSPYGVAVSQQFVRDSNVLRAIDAAAQSDTVSASGLRLMLDQPLGRHRLHANASYDVNRYSNLDYLNNNSYQADVGLDWTAAGLWSGEVGAEASSELFLYDLRTVTPVTEKTEQRVDRVFARARVGVVTAFTFDAGFENYRRNFSAERFANRDLNWRKADMGVRWQPQSDFSVRGAVAYAEGEYPRLSTGDEFTRNELRTVVFWRPSGASTVDASAAVSRERHSLQTARSTTYWSGSVKWAWQPTGKLGLTTRVVRDSDAGASDQGSVLADAKLRTTFEVTGNWLATSKVNVQVQARRVQRQIDSTFLVLTEAQQASDATHTLSVAASYQPMRAVELGCRLQREQRSVGNANPLLTYAFSANVASCYGQLWWR